MGYNFCHVTNLWFPTNFPQEYNFHARDKIFKRSFIRSSFSNGPDVANFYFSKSKALPSSTLGTYLIQRHHLN